MVPYSLTSTFHFRSWTIRYGIHEGRADTADATRPTVVFVHGTPWSSVVFQDIAHTLTNNGHRILLYDLPGYGQSQELDTSCTETSHDGLFRGDTSVKAQGAALAALLQQVKLDGKNGNARPAIIAHDIAGTIVMRTHLIHGCDFHSMLLMDTNCVLPWGDGFYKLVRSNPQVFIDLPPGIFEAMLRAVVRSALHSSDALADGWEEALVKPWIGNAERQKSFVRQIAQANDEDVAEMLEGEMYGKVRCEVQILWGEDDQWIPREKLDQLGDMLGHKFQGLVPIVEAGHLIMLDSPSRVQQEVEAWLA